MVVAVKPVIKTTKIKKPYRVLESDYTVPEPTKRAILLREFDRIRSQNGGLLIASAVVDEAKHKSSPLHRYFQWDDTEAAYQYRLIQARHLINTVVTIIPHNRHLISAYVSLREDRLTPGGAYRAMVDVLSNEEQREKLLYEALEDLRTWERKYRRLAELVPIYQAIESVRKKTRK